MPTRRPQDSPNDGNSSPWPLYSRNGRKIACLPCRRRKLACDHGLPTCQRCQRAKTASLCVYETSAADTNKRPRRSIASPSGTSEHEITPRTDVASSADTQHTQSRSSMKRTEFLGPTSITTIIQELDGQLFPSPGTKHSLVDSPRLAETSELLDTAPVKDHVLSVAIEVLQCIPDLQTSILLIRRCQSPVDGWVRPAVYHLCNSLHETFKPYGKTRRANLAHLARVLIQNTNTVLDEPGKNAEEWLDAISGLNFRWECVGILFAYWTTTSFRRGDDSDDQLSTSANWSEIREKKANISQRYLQCIHHCIEFCGRTGAGNSMLVHLLLKTSHLASIQHGDTSFVAERLLAESISVATTLGIHVSSSPNMTSFTTELRRRLFAHVFIVDKNSAILTGRPPRLSRRYCSAPIPLDVSDDIVMNLPGHLIPIEDVAPGRVDIHGWNTEGLVLKTTLTRTRALYSYIRDAILELVLGVDQNLDISTLRELKQRQEALHKKLPPLLHLDNSQISDPMDTPTRFAKSLARLDHLQNLFFINRLLVKATSSMNANMASFPEEIPEQMKVHMRELMRVSFDMLAVVLGLWTHGTPGPSALHINHDWIIVDYACPAAGVLCGELLRPQMLDDGMSGLRRSDVVHQLSLLSGFLTWIGPEAANASLWMTVKDVIHRVLDQLLNGPAPPIRPQGNAAGAEDGLDVAGMLSDVELPNDFHDLYAFDLLNSFDWLRQE